MWEVYLARVIDIGLLYIDVYIMIKIDCEGCKWSGAASSTAAFTPSLAHYLTTIEQERGEGGEREGERERHHYHVDDDVHCHPTDSAYQLHSGSHSLLDLPRRMAAWMREPSV